jgi:hypothetical protein
MVACLGMPRIRLVGAHELDFNELLCTAERGNSPRIAALLMWLQIKLLHRFKPGQGPQDNEFWRSFVDKCRLAWGVFFPPSPQTIRRQSMLSNWAGGLGKILAPRAALSAGEGQAVNGLSAKQVVLSRLQMVLIADR